MRLAPKEATYFLCCILLLAFLLRIYPLEAYHGWDESTYLEHAEQLFSGKSNYSEMGFRPPLLPILIAGGFFLWHSAWIAVIISGLLATSLAFAVYLIAKKLHSVEAGLFASFIAALHPLFVYHGHLILTDALVASLAGFALYFALDDHAGKTFVAGIFAALASLMKFTGLGIVAILSLLLAWRSIKNKFRLTPLVSFACGFALFFAPYLFWAQQKYGNALIVFEKAQAIVNYVQGGPLFYLHPELFFAPLLAGIILSIIYWRKHPSIVPFAALSIGWTALLLIYLTTFPNRETRYALIAFVPLIVLAGVGYALLVQQVKHKKIVVISILIIIALFSTSSFSRLSEPSPNYWQSPSVEIAQHITMLNTSRPIYTTSFYPVYGYYTNNDVIVIDGPHFLDAYPRIMPRSGYLVVYKDRTREPTVAWADSRPELHRLHENEQAVLYKYEKDY
jgi:4-amino-4-deoxy-L-arabinose transferase-like glycosyltransferase